MSINPAVGAALIGGFSNLFGGAVGSAGAANLNKKNMLFQAHMLRQQQQYNDSVIKRQMDYNDKINQQNFEWNNPLNVRNRLENAGFNPFLHGTEASGAAQSASFGTGSSSLPSGGTLNPLGPLAEGVSALGQIPTSYYAAQAASTQNDIQKSNLDTANYIFERMKANDAVNFGGVSAYLSDALQKIVSINNSRSIANQNAIKARVDKMQEDFFNAPAFDENGQPVVDENGNSVNNFNAQNNETTKAAFANVQRMLTDIQKGKVDMEKVKIDTLIGKYNLEHILPQQLENLKMELNKLQSDIVSNYAQADAARSSAFANMQSGFYTAAMRSTENALRPFKVRSSNAQSQTDYMDNEDRKAQFIADSVFRRTISYPGSHYGYWSTPFRYVGGVLGGLTAPVLGSLKSLLK